MKLVCNLKSALDAYWAAENHREQQGAYHEILLFGGIDGYAPSGSVRSWLAQQARRFALWVERRDMRDRSVDVVDRGKSRTPSGELIPDEPKLCQECGRVGPCDRWDCNELPF